MSSQDGLALNSPRRIRMILYVFLGATVWAPQGDNGCFGLLWDGTDGEAEVKEVSVCIC